MKFKGAAGTTGISVGGQFFQADADGVVEVPDDGSYAQALAPFGFVPIPTVKAETPFKANIDAAAEPAAATEAPAKVKRTPKAAAEPAADEEQPAPQPDAQP